ncbi:MAG: TIGR02466 family protein [Endozoicomonas sp.]
MDKQASPLYRELYFSTPIFFRDGGDACEFHAEMKPLIYQIREEDTKGITRSNMRQAGAWHSQVNLHTQTAFSPLVEFITGQAREIFQDLGYDPDYEPAIDTLWANISSRNAYNRAHIHPNSLWSGVYYVQVPEDAGRIFFIDPRTQAMHYTPRYDPDKKREALTWNEVFFEPQEGRLILFPSWLQHEVEPNMSSLTGEAGNRISISFNIYQRKA